MQHIPSPSSSSSVSLEHSSLFLSRYLRKVTLSTKPQQDQPLVLLRQMVPIKYSQSLRILSHLKYFIVAFPFFQFPKEKGEKVYVCVCSEGKKGNLELDLIVPMWKAVY